MNVNETERLKRKFDDLMQAVEAFGTESAQLSQTSRDLNGLIGGFQNLGMQFSAMAAQCQEYLDAVNQLVSGGLAQQAERDVSVVSETAHRCKEQAETLTALYQKVAGDFLERTDSITGKYQAAVRALQEAAGEVRTASAHLEMLLQNEPAERGLVQEMLSQFIAENRAQAEKNAALREALSKYLEASGFPLL